MSKQIEELPILIVGGGPVGLGMHIELGRRGIRSLLIEQGDGTIEHPRTGLVAIRTMEIFRQWGIAQDVRACGFPQDYELSMVFCTSLTGKLLDREPYPSMRDAPTPSETPEKSSAARSSGFSPFSPRRRCATPLAPCASDNAANSSNRRRRAYRLRYVISPLTN